MRTTPGAAKLMAFVCADRMENLRGGSRANTSRRSSQGGTRLRYGQVVKDEDDARALSSASTPVHNLSAGKGGMSAGRASFPLPQMDNDLLLSKLPRHRRDGQATVATQAHSASMNGRPAPLSRGLLTPNRRDENEAPHNGAPRLSCMSSAFVKARLLMRCSRRACVGQ